MRNSCLWKMCGRWTQNNFNLQISTRHFWRTESKVSKNIHLCNLKVSILSVKTWREWKENKKSQEIKENEIISQFMEIWQILNLTLIDLKIPALMLTTRIGDAKYHVKVSCLWILDKIPPFKKVHVYQEDNLLERYAVVLNVKCFS